MKYSYIYCFLKQINTSFRPNMLLQVVTLLIFILEVPGMNIGHETDYSD
jgi:hypothetical protein